MAGVSHNKDRFLSDPLPFFPLILPFFAVLIEYFETSTMLYLNYHVFCDVLCNFCFERYII